MTIYEMTSIVGGGDVEIVHGILHTDKAAFCELIEQRTSHRLSLGMWPG
jgi:hypothetical protein